MGRLLGIATRPATKVPMTHLESARISEAAGVEGEFRGKPGPRQVVVVGREGWDAACRELGVELEWTLRRGNLLVEGVALRGSNGAQLRIGDALLLITGECDPCWVMDKQYEGLRKALTPEWRGGVACRVLRGGDVAVGDEVALLSAS
jgi:MOSC domain-containing protein YiiM